MTLFFYVAVFAVFLLSTGFRLFAEGMFVDGVTYAAIARNLAEGRGTFWEPFLSATLYPQFHEHPPLAIGMQGLAFRIFGDSLLVERLYSLMAFILTAYLIVLIWKELTGDQKSGWIPLLLWILFPVVSWAAASNLLDNTLGIFTTLAIWLTLKHGSRKQEGYLIAAGLSLFCGFLVKGPFALFPWVIPILWQLSHPGYGWKKATSGTVILIISTLLPMFLLVTFSSATRESLHAYWMNQVVGSIGSVQTVPGRFYIVGSWLLAMILPLLTAALTVWVFRKHLVREEILNNSGNMLFLLLVGLCGVLPVMISLKQSSFYILSALPLFALMLALPLHTILQVPLARWNADQPSAKVFRYSVILLLAVALILPPVRARHNTRDRLELEMIHDFSRVIPTGSTIRIHPDLFTDWSLHSYFQRHSSISLDPSGTLPVSFYLVRDSEMRKDTAFSHLTPIRELNGYMLFKK